MIVNFGKKAVPVILVIIGIDLALNVEAKLLRSFSAIETCFDVKLTTKEWGNEIKWKLGKCKSNRKYRRDKVYTKQCCLTSGIHKLTCKDAWGDGWNGGYIEILGQRYCADFNSEIHEEKIQIGTPPSPPTSPPSPMYSRDDECQIDSDCNDNPDVRSDECKPGYKNMTTNCECLKEMWCRDKPKGSRDFDDCPLWCYPKKVEGCSHWGGDCNVCQQTRGSNPCIYKDVNGTCQDNGKCDYPDNKCRTNFDCGHDQYCTWHDMHVSGSCDPGYYSPSECPLGQCLDYASDQCYSNTECGPGKFCTEDDCQDQCPPGVCLPCDFDDPRVIEAGYNAQNLAYYCDEMNTPSDDSDQYMFDMY